MSIGISDNITNIHNNSINTYSNVDWVQYNILYNNSISSCGYIQSIIEYLQNLSGQLLTANIYCEYHCIQVYMDRKHNLRIFKSAT